MRLLFVLMLSLFSYELLASTCDDRLARELTLGPPGASTKAPAQPGAGEQGSSQPGSEVLITHKKGRNHDPQFGASDLVASVPGERIPLLRQRVQQEPGKKGVYQNFGADIVKYLDKYAELRAQAERLADQYPRERNIFNHPDAFRLREEMLTLMNEIVENSSKATTQAERNELKIKAQSLYTMIYAVEDQSFVKRVKFPRIDEQD